MESDKKAVVTAEMIRAVRKETRAGSLDCKDALIATNGDVEKAIEHLKAHGKVTPKKTYI